MAGTPDSTVSPEGVTWNFQYVQDTLKEWKKDYYDDVTWDGIKDDVSKRIEAWKTDLMDSNGLVIGGLAVGGAAIAAVPLVHAFKQHRTAAALKELNVTEYYLPTSELIYNATFGKLAASFKKEEKLVEPQFDDATQKAIDGLAEQIRSALESGGRIPLPNIILEGKPGVGKTILVEYLARTVGAGFIRIPSGALESHLTAGTHITALQKVLELAKSCPKPVIVIMDDGEELVKQRPKGDRDNPENASAQATKKSSVTLAWERKEENAANAMAQGRVALVNAILEESGKDRRNVAFAITTNRSTVIDSAFRTRARTLEIAPPKEDERARILAEHLPRIFNDDQLTYFGRNRVEMMANLTKDFTGRNLVKLLEQIAATAKISKGRINESMILASIDSTRVAIKKDQAV